MEVAMKKFFFILLLILASCASEKIETVEVEPLNSPDAVVIESSEPDKIAPPESTPSPKPPPASSPPILPPKNFAENWADFAYSSAFSRSFIYNPYDNCFYISLRGEAEYGLYLERDGFIPEDSFDFPHVEKFCKINATTNETTLLLDNHVSDLFYHDEFIYFFDEREEKFKRIKNNLIEDAFDSEDEIFSGKGTPFYIHNNIMYFRGETSTNVSTHEGSRVRTNYAVSLYCLERGEFLTLLDENLSILFPPTLSWNVNKSFQIHDGIFYFFKPSQGFLWLDNENNLQIYENAATLLCDFYSDDQEYVARLREGDSNFSFIYDGKIILFSTGSDLFFIRPETDELQLIANGAGNYTIHDGSIYYVSSDSLFEYEIESKKTTMIISFQETDGFNEYKGYENLDAVKFLNNRCFFFMSGWRTYSYSRLAEFDFASKTHKYLTEFFPEKNNFFTELSGITFEYPNEISVFCDYGSSGGTLLSNFKQRYIVQMNPLGYDWQPLDAENAKTSRTAQGFSLHVYSDEETGNISSAIIANGNEIRTRVNILGDAENIKRNEDVILRIINSIRVK